MQILLSSPGRLTIPDDIVSFAAYFRAHGALGYSVGVERKFSELEKLRILPLVFGLMPKEVLARTRYDDRLKPAITRHLSSLTIQPNDELVTILKNIGDQFFKTADKKASWCPRKFGIGDVRSLKRVYQKMKDDQGNRCALCGVPFDGKIVETLDHVIPWRLVGDIHDGCNWQMLCEVCNSGKGHQITIFQFKEFWNWLYTTPLLTATTGRLSRELRYLILARDEHCTHQDCNLGPRETRLYVQSELRTGLPIFDAFTTKCEIHAKVRRDCLQDHS